MTKFVPPIIAKRILVLEDDFLIAMDLEELLQGLGMTVVGPATNLEWGLELARSQSLDCAVLDVNLGDGIFSTPVADVLSQRGIPFAFITGYWGGCSIPQHDEAPRLQKPFTSAGLKQVIEAICPSF